MKNCKTALAAAVILLLSIIAYQQNQIIQLQQNADTEKLIESYLTTHYGVASIEELIQKKLKEYGLHYTGNPFTTALYPGQFQAENITGMHWYTYLGGVLQNITDVLAYPELPINYVIWTNGTCYYAKNVTSGQVEFKSTNASWVIESAVESLPTLGGKVYVKAGRYKGPIYINKANFILEGEFGTVFYGESGDGYILTIESDSPYRTIGAIIKNIHFEGPYDTKDVSGIRVANKWTVIDNVVIYWCSYGIVTHTSAGVVTVVRSKIGECSKNGIDFSSAGDSHIYFNEIYGNGYYGLYITGHTFVIGNYIYQNGGNTYGGINAYPSDESIIALNIVRDNYDGIRLVSGSDRNIIIGNLLFGNSHYDIIITGSGNVIANNYFSSASISSGNIVRGNSGYITENCGIATGLADGSYIAHGLAGTPTTVTLTCLNSTYDGVPVIVSWDKANTNSTHIAVNIYWANGTAITNPVIAVSWRAEYQP